MVLYITTPPLSLLFSFLELGSTSTTTKHVNYHCVSSVVGDAVVVGIDGPVRRKMTDYNEKVTLHEFEYIEASIESVLTKAVLDLPWFTQYCLSEREALTTTTTVQSTTD